MRGPACYMDNMTITLVYAQSAQQQFLHEVVVPVGSTILQVIEASGVCTQYPEIDLKINKVGMLSQVQGLETIVQPFDRVEIYRPLIFDPMLARRLRAKGLAPSQRAQDSPLHQKTPSNGVVQPIHPAVVTDTHNPNDQD